MLRAGFERLAHNIWLARDHPQNRTERPGPARRGPAPSRTACRSECQKHRRIVPVTARAPRRTTFGLGRFILSDCASAAGGCASGSLQGGFEHIRIGQRIEFGPVAAPAPAYKDKFLSLIGGPPHGALPGRAEMIRMISSSFVTSLRIRRGGGGGGGGGGGSFAACSGALRIAGSEGTSCRIDAGLPRRRLLRRRLLGGALILHPVDAPGCRPRRGGWWEAPWRSC